MFVIAYQVLLDGIRIHDLTLHRELISPAVELSDNSPGSFKFDIPPDNPGYDKIKKLTSVVQVLKDGEEIFCGRVLDEESDFYGIKSITCEGDLAYLLDSIQRPGEYHNMTPRAFLETLLNNHNSQVEDQKKIYCGNVTVTDPNDSIYRYTNWETTLDDINDKLVDRLGGHLVLRKESGKKYLDYYASYDDFRPQNTQKIEFGKNLLDFSQTLSAADVATAIIPLGARQEKEEDDPEALERYLTIESVNDGKDYVYDEEAVNQFGWVYRTVKFDDVTVAANLKTKGEQYLHETQFEQLTLSVKALDLNLLYADIKSIQLGDNIRVISKPHGLDKYFPVLQRSYHLDAPEQDTITLGTTLSKGYVSQAAGENTELKNQIINKIPEQISVTQEQSLLFAALASASVGCYVTVEQISGGSTITYYHDRPELDQSQMVRRVTGNGVFISATGKDGPWYGVDKNANALFETLTARTVIADKVKAGQIKSVDNSLTIDLGGSSLNMNLDDGSKVVIGKDGFYNMFGESKNEYFHLILAEEFEATEFSGIGLAEHTFILPQEFEGKEITVIGSISGIFAPEGCCLKDFAINWIYDGKTRTVTASLSVVCYDVSSGIQVNPLRVPVNIIVLA